MRKLFFLLVFAGCSCVGNCETLSSATVPLKSAVEIAWSAPTNNWPDALWIYKVAPQVFPPAIVSNLMVLGSFTEKDRTNCIVGEPPFKDKSIVYYRNRDQSKYLGFYPALGFIDYHDESAQARMTDPVVSVPSETDVIPLALKYIRLVGIDRDQLATKPGSSDLDLYGEKGSRGHNDPTTGKEITEVINRAVLFVRRVDGVSFRGIGLNAGAKIKLGNEGKVIDLRVYWRNLKPYELHESISSDQVTSWIRSGQIPLPLKPAQREKMRKITVTKATPHYDCKFGDEPDDFVAPLLELEAVVEGEEPVTTFQLKSPVIAPKLAKAPTLRAQ